MPKQCTVHCNSLFKPIYGEVLGIIDVILGSSHSQSGQTLSIYYMACWYKRTKLPSMSLSTTKTN